MRRPRQIPAHGGAFRGKTAGALQRTGPPLTKANIERVERLEVNGKIYQAWQEAVEEVDRSGRVQSFSLLLPSPCNGLSGYLLAQESEAIRDESGLIVGILQRDKASIAGTIELAAEQVQQGLLNLRAQHLRT